MLIGEAFEQQGRYSDAIRFGHAELEVCVSMRMALPSHGLCTSSLASPILRLFACSQDKFNFTSPSKMRAGQLLGRCHAALGQQSLSATAFDAAIGLAQTTRFLLQVREPPHSAYGCMRPRMPLTVCFSLA